MNCYFCGKPITIMKGRESKSLCEHHISYEPEVKVPAHFSCHMIFHLWLHKLAYTNFNYQQLLNHLRSKRTLTKEELKKQLDIIKKGNNYAKKFFKEVTTSPIEEKPVQRPVLKSKKKKQPKKSKIKQKTETGMSDEEYRKRLEKWSK